jgi:hypothetical protein
MGSRGGNESRPARHRKRRSRLRGERAPSRDESSRREPERRPLTELDEPFHSL